MRIGDVATVAPGVKPVYTIVTANGKPAVLLNINRQPDGNTVQVAQEVHAEIERIRKTLPPGVEIQPFYDQSIIVGQSISSVRDAILLGLILASIILVVFLRDWGTSLVAGLVIPVTVMVDVHRPESDGRNLQPDDAGRTGGGRRPGHRRCHRGGGKHRPSSRRRADAHQAIQSALKEITVPLGGIDDNTGGGFYPFDRDHRGDGSFLPRVGRYHDRCLA